MSAKDSVEKSHVLAAEWFKDHKAELVPGGSDSIVISWRKSGTSNYAMRFTIFDWYVVVTGDVGDAIYSFTGPVTMEKLYTFDWHYFTNKCVASETGRNYTMKYPGIRDPVPNCRAIGHYVGLQMALKQLQTNNPKSKMG